MFLSTIPIAIAEDTDEFIYGEYVVTDPVVTLEGGSLLLRKLSDNTYAINSFQVGERTDLEHWGMEPWDANVEIVNPSDGCYTIVSVDEGAFSNPQYCKTLYVKLPETINNLSEGAFRNPNGDLKFIWLPDSEINIEGNLAGNNSKAGVTINVIPKNLSVIKYKTFDKINIAAFPYHVVSGWYPGIEPDSDLMKEPTLPSGLTEIGNRGLGVQKWTTISFPEPFMSMGQEALKDWTELIDVKFEGNNLKSIGYAAFENCAKLKCIGLPEGLEWMEDAVFQGCSTLEYVSFPSSLTKIQMNLFNNCSSLTEIELNEGVKEIYPFALNGAEKTESLTLPTSVWALGVCALPCSLKSLTVLKGDSFILGDWMPDAQLGSADSPMTEAPLEFINLEREIRSVSDHFYFSNITTLKNVVLGEDVTYPGIPFWKNSSLESIEVHSITPPDVKDFYTDKTFTNEQYANVIVTIPQGATANYLLDPVWKNFLHIQEGEYSGISQIMSDNPKNIEIYDLSGNRLILHNNDRICIQRGVYIMRNGNHSQKIIIE